MKHARLYACLVALVVLAGCIPEPAPPPPPPPPQRGPDLVATDIAWPTPLVVGQRVPFSITVQNTGDTATPANTILDALVTVDGVDVGWSDNLTAPLAPGASRVQTVNGGPDGSDGSWTVTAGAHNVTALVNSGSLPARPPITESNVGNNQLVKPFMVETPTTIAFVSDRTGNPEVWTMNGDGSNQTQLTDSPDLEVTPELSRDGTKIVFTRRNPDRNVFPNTLIWVMNADGSDQHQVFVPICASPGGVPDVCTGVSRDTYPAWSPDGTQIAFVREGNLLGSGIWVMNADGSDARSLRRVSDPRFSSLAWSPDGTQIAYSYDYVCCSVHIVFEHLAGNPGPGLDALIGPVNDADSITFDIAPSWSPNGAQIAFRAQMAFNGPVGIWVATVGGGRASAVRLNEGAGNPSFSPDGRRIAFERAGEIWTMNADGSNQVRLGAGTDPNWAPTA